MKYFTKKMFEQFIILHLGTTDIGCAGLMNSQEPTEIHCKCKHG